MGVPLCGPRNAVVACALERYRLEKGVYPRELKELLPGFMATIPNDVVTGQPPKYRPNQHQDGYLLYSLGFDRVDDGGPR